MIRLKGTDEDIAAICRRNEVRELAVFGSVVRGQARADSDVDVFVEFQPAAQVGFIRIAGLAEELERVFGRHVDLAIKSCLKPLIREQVLREAEVLFAA